MMTSEIRARLEGRVVPAVPVPHDETGRVMEDALRMYANWMSQHPIGAVALGVHTGRGLWLEEDVRGRVMAIWRDAAPEVPIVHGVGVPHRVAMPFDHTRRTDVVIAETVRMAEWALGAGAGAILVHPPTALRYLPGAEERIVDLHRALGDMGVPCLAFYLYDAAGGIAYTRRTVEQLLSLEHVVGIKIATLDSVMRFQDLATVVREANGLLVTGEDRFLGYSLMAGAQTALVGIAAACTDVCCQLVTAVAAGDAPTAVALTRRMDDFARATFVPPMDGYVQRMLWALVAEGVLPTGAVDPHGPILPDSDRTRVEAAVTRLRES